MNVLGFSVKAGFSLLLMMCIANAYADKLDIDAQVQEAAAEAMEVAEAEAVPIPASDTEAACRADDACDVVAAVSEHDLYGGIVQKYVVKGCQVTVYKDGPVKMVNIKTDQPCNAPLPKNHVFSKVTKTYIEDGCRVTEYENDAVRVCPKKSKRK
ncbi:hypothetical protein [Acinetobacter sp. MD2]|uniref:hypothetical protein n=1 Tax=Acinetobacter sp. MD2 TaxID=2600066 RepID=UPI002D1F0F63|nr:hypothetical protein [Acinetobacter sp. MD2]MEB3768370.1 hypothetical protein [Acinetobacter sp. MD2]